ncbi:MAG: extracellular solute-binding protein [Clostridia bacterium]|nr:extracellular solute-binding protein [Clostridia bacterium]
MKKFLVLLLAAMMVFSMFTTASASSLAGTYDITVWVANEIVDLTKAQIEEFNNTNEMGIKFNATIEAVSEADAATQMITDVAAGGDIFCFAQDQFARLVQAGALAKLGARAGETVGAANSAGVVAAATAGDTLYAYPLTADNGYFMYYDKTVIPEEHIDSLEAIIADCEAAQKYFAFEMQTSAWYLASFFFATGCVSEWTMDEAGKEFVSVRDTFNSPEGLIAVKGMKKLVDSPFHLSSSQASEFSSGAAVVVTGTWSYTAVQEILGENMGVADLPSFEVDGQSYHIGSFNGCKLMGVKPQVDAVKAAALHQLAQYLTGEKCQLERFEKHAWGPSNLNAQASDAVQANPGLVALNAQAPYSLPQGQIHGSWWDIAKVIGDDVKAAKDEAGLQAALDNYYNKIAALFTMTAEEKNAWGVIGSINGDVWTIDLPMTNTDGVWVTDEAYAMEAGVEFKVRQGKAWDNAFPADNFKVEAAGTYKVQFTEATGAVELIAQ